MRALPCVKWVSQPTVGDTKRSADDSGSGLCTASDRKNAAHSLYANFLTYDVNVASTRASAIIEKKTPVIAMLWLAPCRDFIMHRKYSYKIPITLIDRNRSMRDVQKRKYSRLFISFNSFKNVSWDSDNECHSEIKSMSSVL